MRLLNSALYSQEAGSKEKEMVSAPASLRLGLTLTAQAHRYHFDRKHPADLNRGFGRQEESRRNGSHLVCLSESERRRRLWRRRELLRSYTSQGLPPFPRPLPRPFSPPQATQPAQLPAESEVRYSADPFLFSGSLPPPLPRRLAFGEPDSAGQGRGRRRQSPRPGTRAVLPLSEPRHPPRPLRPGPALGQDPCSLGPHHRLFGNKWSWSIARSEKPLLRGSLGKPHLPEEAEGALGRRGRRGGLNERALGTGPPTPRVKMAVWEDAGFGAGGGGGGPGASSASSEGQPPAADFECVGRRPADPASAGAVGPEGGGGPLARDCCSCSSSFFFPKGRISCWEY